MPKIEDVKRHATLMAQSSIATKGAVLSAKITLAAIEDAARWKFDNNTPYWQDESTLLWHQRGHKQVPAAVRAVLEVTGEKQ